MKNRLRITRAARDAFSEVGLAASIPEVARHAGTGTATVYRHFPTKRDLIVGAFETQMAACADAVYDASLDPDPWRAFRTCVETLCAIHVTDRGFTAAFLSTYPDTDSFGPAWRQGERRLAAIIDRAQAAGHLHAEIGRADLTLLLMAVGGIATEAGDSATAASERLVSWMLRSLQSVPDAAERSRLPPPVSLGLHFDVSDGTP